MSFTCLLAIGGGPAENLSIFDPASPSATSIRSLAFLILAITAFIFVIVEGILIYAIVRFRHGPPRGAKSKDAAKGSSNTMAEPPQVYGSTPIEIAWTAAPALIVFVLALVITRTLWAVKVDPDRPPLGSKPLRVTVIGHQWWWEYVYESYDGQSIVAADGQRLIAANELHVPASDFAAASERRPVYLALQSADVCHSFWVPRLGGKTDLIPGRTNHMMLETDRTGLFLGQCAEYCGCQHAGMLIRVHVDTPEDFARWLEAQKQRAADEGSIAETSVAAGRAAFLAQSCVKCHRVRGTTAAGTYGPDLTHLMSRETLASGMVPNTRENLRQWIADPQKTKPGCLMPAFGLGERELDLIVNYLSTLR